MKARYYLLASADHSSWKDGMSSLDGLPVRDSGVWILQKHRPLVYYSEIFNQAMKDKDWENRVYFELFAGPGRCLIRGTNEEDWGSPLKIIKTNFTQFSQLHQQNGRECAP